MNVKRTGIILRPDCSRVLVRPFSPTSEQRAQKIVARVVSLAEKEAEALLEQILGEFSGRHTRIRPFFLERFEWFRRRWPVDENLSEAKKLLIGAYFTQEYSVEAAALFNPAIVPHPDQTHLPLGALRFILSLRATGEGHISSLTFRTGIVDAKCHVALDSPTRYVNEPSLMVNPSFNKVLFERKLREVGLVNELTSQIMEPLVDPFTLREIEERMHAVMIQVEAEKKVEKDFTVRGITMLAKSNFEVQFLPNQHLSERVIFPASPTQINGIEDARFVQFQNEDGSKTYFATYTAFDGKLIFPQLLETSDFLHFKFITLNGTAVQNKGMALFSRKINGQYAMLSRQDNENISIMFSDNVHFWYSSQVVLKPKYPWEFVQLGNCGSPIETEDGWLVLSHGVGPVRKYCVGAFLLDRQDPTKVIGRLREPLLKPSQTEREGYVPNVVYTCGTLLHQGHLIIPYAMSDQATSFATVSLREVLAAMEV
ncbi:MAG: glycoside hydrolase family 130 protein [Planctomycetota bacterium]